MKIKWIGTCAYELRNPQPNDDGCCGEPAVAVAEFVDGRMPLCAEHLEKVGDVEEEAHEAFLRLIEQVERGGVNMRDRIKEDQWSENLPC